MKDLEITSLLEGDSVTARELERAAVKDSEVFRSKFFEDFLTVEIRKWIAETKSEKIMDMIYSNSFMYGACASFNAIYENIDEEPRGCAARFRPSLFSQIIAPNRDLTKWIEATGCMDFIYALYEESFVFGFAYMIDIIEDTYDKYS